MYRIIIAAAATSILALAATAAQAQPYSDYQGSDQNPPNAQAQRDYQDAQGAYEAQRDAAAQQQDAYQRKSADYQAEHRAYEHRLRLYERARAEYDAEYGPGAYERYYSPPPPY